MMFSGIFLKKEETVKWIAIAGMCLLIVCNVLESKGITFLQVNSYNMLVFNDFGLYFNTLIFGSTLAYFLLSGSDVVRLSRNVAEFFALIFFVLCGAAILSAYNNLLLMFIGIEILSIPLYILTGSDKHNLKSNEAALKYFLMGAFSTGLMLMGIALLYGANGSFYIDHVRGTFLSSPLPLSILEVAGMIFLLASFAFKVSAAPFHFWTPDVYDGAPTVFTSFMSTIAKAAGFIAFYKLFEVRAFESSIFNPSVNKNVGINWQLFFALLVVATLLIGNVTAVFQQSVKRMLAYSSIAQAGFMLLALLSLNGVAREGILYYSLAYSLATIGIFAVLIKMKDLTFEGFNGLAKTQPVLAATATVFLLSLAGIPLTGGFFAKYFMLASVMKTGHYTWLVILAVIFAAISVYYYFRVIQAMYFKEGNAETQTISQPFKWGLIAVAIIVCLIGIFPDYVIQWLYF